MPTLDRKLTDAENLHFKIARLVRSPKRKRKLNARGDLCQWSNDLQGWLWYPHKIGPLVAVYANPVLRWP